MTHYTRSDSGRFLDANGYARLRVASDDWQYEHRVVWERAHGPIPPGFHVHHRNHIRDDNRLENLELVDGRIHSRRHTIQRHRTRQLDARGSKSVRWRGDLDDSEIVRRVDSGESFRSIGRALGARHNVIAHHYRLATS